MAGTMLQARQGRQGNVLGNGQAQVQNPAWSLHGGQGNVAAGWGWHGVGRWGGAWHGTQGKVSCGWHGEGHKGTGSERKNLGRVGAVTGRHWEGRMVAKVLGQGGGRGRAGLGVKGQNVPSQWGSCAGGARAGWAGRRGHT